MKRLCSALLATVASDSVEQSRLQPLLGATPKDSFEKRLGFNGNGRTFKLFARETTVRWQGLSELPKSGALK